MKKKTRYVLLGLLQEEELTGYEMKKIIDGRMVFFWQESYGQIYPELSKLLKEECIEEIKGNEKGSGREKIRYGITVRGRDELKQWMEAENEKDSTRSEFLLKMYLATDANEIEMKRHLERFFEQSKKQLELFGQFESQLIKYSGVHGNHKQILDVLSLGMKQQELYCAWSKERIENLRMKGVK